MASFSRGFNLYTSDSWRLVLVHVHYWKWPFYIAWFRYKQHGSKRLFNLTIIGFTIDFSGIWVSKEVLYFSLVDEIEEKNVIQGSGPQKSSKENICQRKRRIRSHFTQRQLQYLEKIFSRQQYLTRDERTLLARGLEMTELQIRNWFQNRRYQKKHRALANQENKKEEKPDSLTCEESEV